MLGGGAVEKQQSGQIVLGMRRRKMTKSLMMLWHLFLSIFHTLGATVSAATRMGATDWTAIHLVVAYPHTASHDFLAVTAVFASPMMREKRSGGQKKREALYHSCYSSSEKLYHSCCSSSRQRCCQHGCHGHQRCCQVQRGCHGHHCCLCHTLPFPAQCCSRL